MDAVDALTDEERGYLLAVLESNTLEAAAESVGMPSSTFRSRTSAPQFIEALRESRRAAVRRAAAHLSHRACEAVDVLFTVMRDDLAPPAVRVRAARTVLEQTHRAAEHDDVEERVAALEAWVAVPADGGRGSH